MFIGKTRFSELARIVSRRSGHRLTSRIEQLRGDRLKRLEDIGVRPLSPTSELFSSIPREQRDLYAKAYEALKNSNSTWATEGEIHAILYGDKELSRARSAEVIEIMRRADVPGFKETDEVTSGDIYSERMLNVVRKQGKLKTKEEERKLIEKVTKRDIRLTSDLDIDASRSQLPRSNVPAVSVKLQPLEQPEYRKNQIETPDGSAASANAPAKARGRTRNAAEPPQTPQQPPLDKPEEEDEDEEVPFTYHLNDL